MSGFPLRKSVWICLVVLGLHGTSHGKNAAGLLEHADVVLFVDGKNAGSTWINMSGGKIQEIPGAPVLTALEPLLSRQALRTLEERITRKTILGHADLALVGIEAVFDPVSLRLTFRKTSALRPDAKTARAGQPLSASDSAAVPKIPAIPATPAGNQGPWTTAPVPALPGADDTVTAGKRVESASRPLADSAGAVPDMDEGWDGPAAAPAGAAAGDDALKHSSKPQLQSKLMEQSRDELYEELFKKKAPPMPSRIEATLIVGDKPTGTIWIETSKDGSHYSFPADPVLKALKGLVKKEVWEKLAGQTDGKGNLVPERLDAAGLPTTLNLSMFELRISVPAQSLGIQVHSLNGSKPDQNLDLALKPNKFSAFVNGHIKQRVNYYQNTYDPNDTLGLGHNMAESRNSEARQPVVGELEGATNAFGWVLEGKAVWWERYLEDENRLMRRDVRMVHDWPSRALRLTAGDLIFPTTGYQGFVKMGGLGISRDFSLQPHLAAYPVREFEFFLAHPAEVKVYINRRLTGILHLPQGTHDIQGFPFVQGESEVEIEITDNTGQKQRLSFNFIHEPSLLAEGISAFSYNVGFPSRDLGIENPIPEPGNRKRVLNYQYDLDHPMVFAVYRLGMRENLTAGAYVQGTDTTGLAGITSLYALKIGKFQGDFAGSFDKHAHSGFAGGLDYTFVPNATSRLSKLSWRAKTEYLSSGFRRPFIDTSSLGSLILSGSFQRTSDLLSVSGNASYTIRDGRPDFYSLSATLGKTWMRGLTSSMNIKNAFDQRRMTGTQISANLTYYFSSGYHNLLAGERLGTHRDGFDRGESQKRWDNFTDLRWDYNSSAPFPNNPAASAATSFGPNNNEYFGKLGWKSDQGTADLNIRRIEPAYAGASLLQQNFVEMNLNTALVYVDGSFALARPIQNSFLLVKGVKSEKDCAVIVNPNSSGYDAKSRPYLPGVVPAMTEYSTKKILLEPVDPPIGATELKTDYLLYPTYKSGFALYLGSDASAIGLGTLLLGEGIPLQYLSFTATPTNGTEKDAIVGFTNSAGKFQLPSLKPGSYRISVDVEGREKVAQFKLPKDAQGLFGLGNLYLQDP